MSLDIPVGFVVAIVVLIVGVLVTALAAPKQRRNMAFVGVVLAFAAGVYIGATVFDENLGTAEFTTKTIPLA